MNRLSKVVKGLGYVVLQDAPNHFICRPKRWSGRLFECNKVHVQAHDGTLDLVGPAIVVNRVTKKLQRKP